MTLLLTTTSTITVPELIDTDNQGAVFTHPVTDFDLLTKWSSEDIRAAEATLQTAITAGTISVTYNGAPLSDFATFGLGPGKAYSSIRTITAGETVTFDDGIVVFNGSTGQTITLPSPVSRFGESITIKNKTANDVTVATTAGNIDGFTTITLKGTTFPAIEFVSDGTDWLAV